MLIQEEVFRKVESNNIKSIVIDKLSDKELEKRVETTTQAFMKLDKMELDFKKIDKPDNVYFDSSKAKVEAYTQGRITQIEKDKKAIEDFKLVLVTYLESNLTTDYLKLDKLVNGKSQESNQ